MLNVKDYGAVGDGSANDTQAFAAAIADAQGARDTLIVPAGIYKVFSLPNLAANDWQMIGVGGLPTIKYVGSGSTAVNVDGSFGSPSRKWNMLLANLALEGNSNTTTGFLIKDVDHSRFINLRILSMSSTGTGFKTGHFVLNACEEWVCTSGEGTIGPMPATGIELGTTGDPQTEGNTFINLIVEGLINAGDVGMRLVEARRNTFIGGSCEINDVNIEITSPSTGNKFIGMYTEQATSGGWSIAADFTTLVGCHNRSGGGPDQVVIESGAVFTQIHGGTLGTLTISAGAQHTSLVGVALSGLNDAGTASSYRDVYNITTGLRIAERVQTSTVNVGHVTFLNDNANDVGGPANRARQAFIGNQLRLFGASWPTTPAIRYDKSILPGGVPVTIGGGPTGSTAGHPVGWIPVSINGTTRYMPFW